MSKLCSEVLRPGGHLHIYLSALQFEPWYSVLFKEVRWQGCTGRSGSDPDQEEKKKDIPVFEVKSIPLHNTQAFGTHICSLQACTPKHCNVTEEAIPLWRIGLAGRTFWLNWAIRATEKCTLLPSDDERMRWMTSARLQHWSAFWWLMMRRLVAIILYALNQTMLIEWNMLFQSSRRPDKLSLTLLQVTMVQKGAASYHRGISVLLVVRLTPSASNNLYLGCGSVHWANP